MIFSNPAGAPELACDQCGCRWFDRTAGNVCYECGAAVTPENLAEIEAALAAFAASKTHAAAIDPAPGPTPQR